MQSTLTAESFLGATWCPAKEKCSQTRKQAHIDTVGCVLTRCSGLLVLADCDVMWTELQRAVFPLLL